MRSHRLAALMTALTVTLGLGLAGCGGDDTKAKPKPAETSITGPGSDPSENFDTGKQFINALAGNSAASIKTAASFVAPDSAAARYVARLARVLDKGTAVAPWTVTETGVGRYRLCDSEAPTCTVIAEMLLADGKVATFKVNGRQLR